jgi:hypothetical protein
LAREPEDESLIRLPWPVGSREIHFGDGVDLVPGCAQEGNENGFE